MFLAPPIDLPSPLGIGFRNVKQNISDSHNCILDTLNLFIFADFARRGVNGATLLPAASSAVVSMALILTVYFLRSIGGRTPAVSRPSMQEGSIERQILVRVSSSVFVDLFAVLLLAAVGAVAGAFDNEHLCLVLAGLTVVGGVDFGLRMRHAWMVAGGGA